MLPRALASAAVHQLAQVDYTIANRVTHDIALVVDWSYEHDLPWLASVAVDALQFFDVAGSILIACAVWIVHNTR